MQAVVHAADLQDRDGGVLLMATMFGLYPFLLKLYADGGYQGPKFQQGMARICRSVNVEIVRRCDNGKFVVLPKRWIVERTIAWLNRCRRLSKDWNASMAMRWHSSVGRQSGSCCEGSARTEDDLGRTLRLIAGFAHRRRVLLICCYLLSP